MKRRQFMSAGLSAAAAAWVARSYGAEAGRLNFVFIAMDDLAPWPKPFRGYQGTIITPNFERLAARGVCFQRAYCAVPVSGGSRISTMSGVAPYRSGIWQNVDSLQALAAWSSANPGLPKRTEPMFTAMRRVGYRTGSAGKLYFGPGFTVCDQVSTDCATPVKPETCGASSAIGRTSWESNLPVGWDHVDFEPTDIHTNVDSGPFPLPAGVKPAYYWQKAPATGPVEDWSSETCANPTNYDQVPEANLPDVKITNWAVSAIRNHTGNTPLFLAAGFLRPHASWFVPKRFYDLYDNANIPPVRTRSVKAESADVTDMSLVGCLSLRREQLQRPATASQFATSARYEQVERGVIKGYLASISFVDEQLGKILDAIDASPMRDNTVIVVWGDHGFSFGEKLGWQKQKLYEPSCRVPVLISAPGCAAGRNCDRVVSLLDLFPTILDYAGATESQKPLLDGRSLRPLVENPSAAWNSFAITAFDFTNRVGAASGAVSDPSCLTSSAGGPYLRTSAVADPTSFARNEGSYAVRTERWTYIRYNVNGVESLGVSPVIKPLFCVSSVSATTCAPGAGPEIGREELYDLLNDPEERTNLLAGTPSPKAAGVARLLRDALDLRLAEARSNIPPPI